MLLIAITISLLPCLAIFAILRVNVTMAPTLMGYEVPIMEDPDPCDHAWETVARGHAKCIFCGATKERDADDDSDKEFVFVGIKQSEEI